MPRKSSRAQWAEHIRSGKLGQAKSSAKPVPAVREAFKGTVLGIDPSLRGTGLAVLQLEPGRKASLVTSETVIPPKKAGLPECLGCIAEAVERLVREHEPDVVAIEETIYVQNFRTAQKLGAARGAAIGQAALRRIPVFEYPPLRIKQAVAGYGRASKEQISRQMSSLLGLSVDLPFDEADAAAVALCHAWTGSKS